MYTVTLNIRNKDKDFLFWSKDDALACATRYWYLEPLVKGPDGKPVLTAG